MSGLSERDVERLAAALWVTGVERPVALELQAHAVLNSKWLADRDAAIRDEAKAEALREAAFVMGGIGSHRDPCLPDMPCLCGLCDDREAAVTAIRALLDGGDQ